MTEQELLDEITLVSTAIHHILKTGQKYELGTGQSKRVFEAAQLDSLRSLRKELQLELSELSTGGAGTALGF